MPTAAEFAREVGVAFIKAYYGMSSPPSELAHMYSKDSVFSRTYKDREGEDVNADGAPAVKAYLSAQPQAKYQLTYVECSPTAADGILIVIEGTYCTEYRSNSFYQTFVLARNSRNDQSCYYIHNDSMRVWDDEPMEVVKPAEEYQPQPPAEEPVEEEEAAQEAEIVESIVENVMSGEEPEEVMPEPEEVMLEQVPVPEPEPEVEEPTPAPAVEEPVAEVEEAAPEEPEAEEEEQSTAGFSYAQMLKKRAAGAGAVKTQVVSGGAVPMQPKKPIVTDPEARGKKRQDKDVSALNLIRQTNKGEGKGKGSNGKGSKGSKGEKGEKGGSGFSLYVTKIPKDFSEDNCETVFGTFGKITSKTIRADNGFAYVDFETKAAMIKALAKPVTFGEATLGVEEKKSKDQRIQERVGGKDGGARTQRKEQRRN